MLVEKSETMKIKALQSRKKAAKIDDQELIDKIKEYAEDGEFYLTFVHNKAEVYPTISAELIKTLKKAGYKINLWYKNGWDELHRYYKGALKVSWYK